MLLTQYAKFATNKPARAADLLQGQQSRGSGNNRYVVFNLLHQGLRSQLIQNTRNKNQRVELY